MIVYICTSLCTSVHLCVYVYKCTFLCTPIQVYIIVCLWYIFVCKCTSVCMCTSLCAFVYMCACLHTQHQAAPPPDRRSPGERFQQQPEVVCHRPAAVCCPHSRQTALCQWCASLCLSLIPLFSVCQTASLAEWLRRPPQERKIQCWDLACDRIFLGRVIPVTSKLTHQWLRCQAPGVKGSVLGLVSPVSVDCDRVRWKV